MSAGGIPTERPEPDPTEPDPITRAEMREFIERTQPGLLESLGMTKQEWEL